MMGCLKSSALMPLKDLIDGAPPHAASIRVRNVADYPSWVIAKNSAQRPTKRFGRGLTASANVGVAGRFQTIRKNTTTLITSWRRIWAATTASLTARSSGSTATTPEPSKMTCPRSRRYAARRSGRPTLRPSNARYPALKARACEGALMDLSCS
jgi:hypothetical protein